VVLLPPLTLTLIPITLTITLILTLTLNLSLIYRYLGAQLAVDEVVKILDTISRPISTKEEVAQVGTISANGEREIGDLLSEAMERVGKEGVITVQDGKTLQNELG
jgi:chaperonin GroEL (HSP60 family)